MTLSGLGDTLQELINRGKIDFAEWLRENYIPLPSGWRVAHYPDWLKDNKKIWTTEELYLQYKNKLKNKER